MRRRKRTYEVEEREPLGKRLGRFVTMIAVLAAILGIVVIGQRLDDQSLALVVGLLLAGVPLLALCVVLVILLLRSQRQAQQPPQQVHPPQQQMMMPPIIMQMPAPPQQQQLPWNDNIYTQPSRGWDLIGEDDIS